MSDRMLTIFDGLTNLNNFVGFDDFFSDLMRFDNSLTECGKVTFPPYNVYTKSVDVGAEGEDITEKHTFIEMACAGFSKDDLKLSFDEGLHVLTAEGKITSQDNSTDDLSDDKKIYHYKGIGTRSFKRSWKLEKDLEFVKSSYIDGILTIEFKPKYFAEPENKYLPID